MSTIDCTPPPQLNINNSLGATFLGELYSLPNAHELRDRYFNIFQGI